MGPGHLDQGARRQHADADPPDARGGRRHGGEEIRPRGEHHLRSGEGADPRAWTFEWRAHRPHRIRRRSRAQDGAAQRDDQQPASRPVRDRPAALEPGLQRQGGGKNGGGTAQAPLRREPGGPLRHGGGIRRRLRLSLQRAGGVHHGAEPPPRWRLVPRDVLARQHQAFSVALTRAGDIGSWRSRLPVSLNTALPIAGATVGTPSSPRPVGALSVTMILVWISGMSLMRMTWYWWKFDCCTVPSL